MSAITMNPAALTARVAVAGPVRARSLRASTTTSKAVARSTVVLRVRAEGSADEAAAAAPPKLSMKDAFVNTMGFSGWAPETINGRVAQIAFVAGLGAELATGESFTSQFSAHVGSIAFASGLITLASFMPNLQNADAYKAGSHTLTVCS